MSKRSQPSDTAGTRVLKCSACARPAAPGFAPFCGPGCRDRDLLRWLGEGYRIAGPPLGEDDPALDSDRPPPV